MPFSTHYYAGILIVYQVPFCLYYSAEKAGIAGKDHQVSHYTIYTLLLVLCHFLRTILRESTGSVGRHNIKSNA